MPALLKKTSIKLLWIIFLAFILRLYKITNPILDWHAFRQADTASVTREYLKQGIDLLQPKYHDLSNIQSGKDNPNGYRMVEFPLINVLIAFTISFFNSPLVLTSRLFSVFFSLISILFLFLLVKEISGTKMAYLSALSMALLPYAIYYSRAVLPEPAMLAFFLASLYFFAHHLQHQHSNHLSYFISLIFLSLALLLKPFILCFLPIYLALFIWHIVDNKADKIKKIKPLIINFSKLIIFLLLAVIPLLLWRNWIQHFPTGIPASDWLFNGNHIRFRPAWFRWLFYERITKLILGYSGVIFLLINVIRLKTKEIIIYASWWLCLIAFFIIIATGNVQHDYYQVISIPIICISIARGLIILYSQLAKHFQKKISQILCISLYLSMLLFSWLLIKEYYDINHWEYLRAGQAVDQLTEKNALVIAPAMGDTMFLFQCNRRGWPIGFEIEDKISKGASYYVSTADDDEARALAQKYLTIKKTNEYLIIDLKNPR